MFFLFNIIVAIVLGIIDDVFGLNVGEPGIGLLGIIPILGGLAVLYFMMRNSQAGANPYGPNPKGR